MADLPPDRSQELIRLTRAHASQTDDFLRRLAAVERGIEPNSAPPPLPDASSTVSAKIQAAVAAKKAAKKMKGLLAKKSELGVQSAGPNPSEIHRAALAKPAHPPTQPPQPQEQPVPARIRPPPKQRPRKLQKQRMRQQQPNRATMTPDMQVLLEELDNPHDAETDGRVLARERAIELEQIGNRPGALVRSKAVTLTPRSADLQRSVAIREQWARQRDVADDQSASFVARGDARRRDALEERAASSFVGGARRALNATVDAYKDGSLLASVNSLASEAAQRAAESVQTASEAVSSVTDYLPDQRVLTAAAPMAAVIDAATDVKDRAASKVTTKVHGVVSKAKTLAKTQDGSEVYSNIQAGMVNIVGYGAADI